MSTLLRLKQFLTGTLPGETQYECLDCHATFGTQPQVCPSCGGYDIRAAQWIGEAEDQSGENSS